MFAETTVWIVGNFLLPPQPASLHAVEQWSDLRERSG
jgi:hypothetical protein